MDKRTRKYYWVDFGRSSRDMRLAILASIESVKIHHRERILISCKEEDAEIVEYELRKAERRDEGHTTWEKIT